MVMVTMRFARVGNGTLQEFLAAMIAAKMEFPTIPLGGESRRFIDGHSANRIDCHSYSSRSFAPELIASVFASDVPVDELDCSQSRLGGLTERPHFFSTSFMLHFGQFPGLSWTTSGCMGQVY